MPSCSGLIKVEDPPEAIGRMKVHLDVVATDDEESAAAKLLQMNRRSRGTILLLVECFWLLRTQCPNWDPQPSPRCTLATFAIRWHSVVVRRLWTSEAEGSLSSNDG